MQKLKIVALGLSLVGGAAMASPSNAAESPNGRAGDHNRSCQFYLHHEIPAPKRCYHYFYDVIGPEVYIHGGLVFQDRDAFSRFRSGSITHNDWADRHMNQNASPKATYGAREEYLASSGGASRGAADVEKSGGASRGSGGASRGEHVPQNISGGASGY